MNNVCTRIIDDSNPGSPSGNEYGSPRMCGSTEAVQITKDGFLACQDCRIEVTNRQLYKSDKAVLEANTPTSIYILKTPQGSLKIGRAVDLYRRLQELHRDQFGGRLQVLASFVGTHQDEADLHIWFNDFRITGVLGEQFYDVPAIRDHAQSVGIDPAGQLAVSRYSRYTPQNDPKTNKDYVK
ncbi:GIY-YIG nuclease family protein [Pseudonocardia sp. EC080625-04]|uniref:GIY-YIG nuclease family protein n=1 Tax=Pseudonocardia sp. EC080625-04 TaxID=1096868 RepID=UPI0009E7E5B0|nr:GIY-YIG nuclease family protein [Pseudonocardia sp. EC080625-04]